LFQKSDAAAPAPQQESSVQADSRDDVDADEEMHQVAAKDEPLYCKDVGCKHDRLFDGAFMIGMCVNFLSLSVCVCVCVWFVSVCMCVFNPKMLGARMTGCLMALL
jgi:hypothetical protein